MIYIEMESTDAAFHFSVEEYVMEHFPSDETVMMIWQADNCAMLGCNQIAEAEIDIGYAENERIHIVRRSSGGGTIFTDMGNLLYTVILPHKDPPDEVRKNVADMIIKALREMGIPAEIDGRNDILADGAKFSGMAQYTRHGRICTHGSLLYDTDLDKLARVLTVDDAKIRSKALRSVRSRVTNIKKYLNPDYSIQEFLKLLKQRLFCNEKIIRHTLTDNALAMIHQIYHERYGNPSWTFGRAPMFTFHNSKRFAGGKVEIFLDIAKGDVISCCIRGDFLGIIPIHGLEEVLTGTEFRYQAFVRALEEILIQPYLGNIGKDEFLSCIFGDRDVS
ncbi:MAG: lipoate--protein ligase [Defluviitaleaceae bacterium]|nr:lipoate--protein ligase [Defluviitaleaceae bacterium]